jgi:tetratricopeptide (TPR) repeat protein
MAPDVPPPKTAWTSFILGLVFIYFFIRLSPLSHYVRRLALLRRNAPRVTSPQVRLREDHPDYPMQCMALITSLLVRAHMITEAHVYDEMITMARKALALSPEQTDQRRFACLVLSGTLYARNTLTGEDPLLVEAIELAREAFSSSPPHNSQFLASRSSTLALYLTARYEGTGDDHLLDEAMDLQREAIALCPANEMNRSRLYRNLANSLNARYNRTGDGVSGDEAVSLQREVLSLCPTGHPDRAQSCQDLAKSLFMRYRGSSNDRLLDETVNLGREALALRRTGGQDWAEFGGNLANYLWARYQISGEVHVLDEVIELQSAVQALRPKGHVYRDASCASLGRSLRTRHQRTGDDRLLDEAVDLHREALALCPVSHVNRRCHCENLAQSLFQIYFIRRSNCLLVEAIELEREALGLCPAEDPSRAITCGDLGAMLMAYYFTTGDGSMLDEAIHLQREAIALCPAGHRSRAMLSINLASTLMKHYNPTSDHSVLDEIFDLISQAMAIAPAHTVWRYHGYLCWLHLQRASTTFYDVDKAITCLSKCFENEPDDVLGLMMQVIFRVEPIWQHDLENHGAELVVVYQRLVNVLPLLANFALDIQPQLRALKNFKNVGSDAFVSAALAGNLRSGIETLEVAQGVVWSQTLRYRNPQLQAVPEPLKSELESLLDSIASSADRRYDGQETEFSQRNVLHLHNSRAYSVIQKIRAISGFERFMLGETYEALCTAASAHPIVVLVGARGHFYALIIAPSQLCEHALLSLHLTEDDMREIFSTPGLAKGHRGASALDNATLEAERGMKKILPTHVESPLHRQLRALWLKVVKPVLDYLNLKASDQCIGIL